MHPPSRWHCTPLPRSPIFLPQQVSTHTRLLAHMHIPSTATHTPRRDATMATTAKLTTYSLDVTRQEQAVVLHMRDVHHDESECLLCKADTLITRQALRIHELTPARARRS